jgi:steroid delta-isomerase-like uncharacterized protein
MGAARAIAEQVYAAMQAGDISGLTKLCSPNCELYDVGLTMRGPEQIGQYLQGYFTAFPDMQLEVRRLIEDGESVAAEVRFTGTQTGPLAMPTGELPASGRKIDVEAADFITVQNGQITAWKVYLDSMIFLTQLGLMPEPAAAAAS